MGDTRASPAGVAPEASKELEDSFDGFICLFEEHLLILEFFTPLRGLDNMNWSHSTLPTGYHESLSIGVFYPLSSRGVRTCSAPEPCAARAFYQF